MKKLQLTVHDVSPVHAVTLEEIHTALGQMGVVRYSMLVVPDYHGKWPLGEYPEFCDWLKGLADSGVEMVLHGFSHRGSSAGLGMADRIRSALFTRNEGEFLGLDRPDAEKLLEEGREVLQQLTGIEVNGFVAPAWLYNKGTTAALKNAGFSFTESRWRIWDPRTGQTILRVPIVNYAGGIPLKRFLAALWVSLSGKALAGSETVRFAIHPHDFKNESVRKAVLKRLKTLLGTRSSVCFQDIIPVP